MGLREFIITAIVGRLATRSQARKLRLGGIQNKNAPTRTLASCRALFSSKRINAKGPKKNQSQSAT